MQYLTNEKLVIVGAAGMIGSNMAQSALMMGLTTNLCLYDVFSPEGVAEEMRQSGFDDVNITANKNTIPFDPEKPTVTSGVRVGTPAATARGFKEEDFVEVANIIADCIFDYDNKKEESIKRVKALTDKYPVYPDIV